MTDTSSNNSNGRVTMAKLGIKLDTVIAQLDRLEEHVYTDHDRLTVIEGRTDGHTRRIKDLEKKSVVRAWEGRIESLLIAGLAAVGIVRQ